MSSILNFICPECPGLYIEEVVSGDVAVLTTIDAIDEAGHIDYGRATNEGGYVVRYQCRGCGYVIVDDATCGDDALDEHALVKALKSMEDSRPE